MQAKIRGHWKIMTHVSIWRSCDGFSAVGALEVRNQNKGAWKLRFLENKKSVRKKTRGSCCCMIWKSPSSVLRGDARKIYMKTLQFFQWKVVERTHKVKSAWRYSCFTALFCDFSVVTLYRVSKKPFNVDKFTLNRVGCYCTYLEASDPSCTISHRIGFFCLMVDILWNSLWLKDTSIIPQFSLVLIVRYLCRVIFLGRYMR